MKVFMYMHIVVVYVYLLEMLKGCQNIMMLVHNPTIFCRFSIGHFRQTLKYLHDF